MTRDAIQDCSKWLSDSFHAFKLRAQQTRASADILIPGRPKSASLQSAFCEGDLERAALILADPFENSDGGRPASFSMLLPVILQLEKDWLSGQRSYADTVYAFWNVERVMSRLENRISLRTKPKAPAWGMILLATAPDTQHVFGLSVVDDSFRAAGWDTQNLTNCPPAEIVQAAELTHADFIGLSVGHDEGLIDLGQFISLLREKSRNPTVKVILGGNVFSAPANQYDWLGADHVALNVEDALEYCSGWMTTEFLRH